MKIILQHLHYTPSASLTALIEQQLGELGKTRQIDEARVVLEHRPEGSPPFSVSAHLVTPGPDVFAEAADYTLRAALQKTMAQLVANIALLQARRTRRAQENRQASPPARLAPSAPRN